VQEHWPYRYPRRLHCFLSPHPHDWHRPAENLNEAAVDVLPPTGHITGQSTGFTLFQLMGYYWSATNGRHDPSFPSDATESGFSELPTSCETCLCCSKIRTKSASIYPSNQLQRSGSCLTARTSIGALNASAATRNPICNHPSENCGDEEARYIRLVLGYDHRGRSHCR
jgi:hypothetical protein